MKLTKLTYAMLLEGQQKLIELGQLKPQTFANRATALRKFLEANHLNEEDVVGLEMRPLFPLSLEKMVDKLHVDGFPSRAISNTKSALMSWKQAVIRFDTDSAHLANLPTPFLSVLKAAVGEQPVKLVARQAGVPFDMLWGWLHGKSPRASSAKYVRRLEVFFGLERDSLFSLAGFADSPKMRDGAQAAAPVEFRERQRARTKNMYYLDVPLNSPLREQWREFIKYKTAQVPQLERTKRGQWTPSSLNAIRPTESKWFQFLDGVEVPSAYAAGTKTLSYLGFLGLPAAEGGAGIPVEDLQTLAWLVVPGYVERYLEWTKIRAGKKTTQGAIQFIAMVSMLTRPTTGYLSQKPEFLLTLPEQYRSENWEKLCTTQFTFLAKLEAAIAYEVTAGRDSFAPIQHILDLPQPMEAIADMIQRMRADRPTSCEKSEAIWARDIFMVKLCASNPLRKRNIACLEWAPGNRDGKHPSDKCSLYQRVDGSWWIFVPKRLLKNRKGAQIDDYDSPVHSSVWVDLERYLYKHRPILMRFPTKLVLIASSRDPSRTTTVYGKRAYKRKSESQHHPFMDFSKRLYELTRKYLWQCDGIGSHAFRHITATSILKAPGGDIKTAALVLNDSELTVHKNYSGMRSGDGAKRMGDLLSASLNRM